MFQKLSRALLGLDHPRQMLRLLPGVLLATAVLVVALPVAKQLGLLLLRSQGLDSGRSPLSAVPVAIILGLLIRNVFHLPVVFSSGIRFCVVKILRLGIICIGIKLSLLDILQLGAWGIPVVMGAIATGLIFVTWFNRLLKLPERLGLLIAAGTSICGVTAIVSTAPAIDADDDEVTYAVGVITLFGLVGMLTYPYLAPLLFGSSEQIGLLLGTAIHDTSQVIGAAMTYREVHNDDVAFQTATVTKLTRNLFLAAVVPLMAMLHRRRMDSGDGRTARPKGVLPGFIVAFLVLALIRTIGDAIFKDEANAGFLTPAGWTSLTQYVGGVLGAQYFLGVALAAIGLDTSFSVFKRMGFKPFVVGLIGALVVGAVGWGMATLVGHFVQF